MDIIVPFSIRKRELDGTVSAEAKKVFEKVKESPKLAVTISAKALPPRMKLHKFYATTADGARRLLFFCQYAPPPPAAKSEPGKKAPAPPPAKPPPERWVLLFYRDKGDAVGDNMSPKDAAFVSQMERNLIEAMKDLQLDTPQNHLYEQF